MRCRLCNLVWALLDLWFSSPRVLLCTGSIFVVALSMPKMACPLHSFLLAHLEMEKWTCFSGLLLATGLHFALDIEIHAIGLTVCLLSSYMFSLIFLFTFQHLYSLCACVHMPPFWSFLISLQSAPSDLFGNMSFPCSTICTIVFGNIGCRPSSTWDYCT